MQDSSVFFYLRKELHHVARTEIRSEKIVAITTTSNQNLGEKMMEFKKLAIDSLVPASYNPRKKLKPGDSEFEKIKNSISQFGYVDPIIVEYFAQ